MSVADEIQVVTIVINKMTVKVTIYKLSRSDRNIKCVKCVRARIFNLNYQLSF